MAAGWININDFNELQRLVKNIQVYNGEIKYHAGGINIICGGGEGGGTAVSWAVVTAVTDANNYTCSIWSSRGSYVNGDDADTTGAAVRVPDIADTLSIGDGFPVGESAITGEDYEAIQQLGLL